MLDPKYVASMLVKHWLNQDTTAGYEDVENKIARQIAYSPIEQGQSGVIAWNAPKTAALCFDRVWSGQPDHVPEGIRFFNGTNEELAIALATSAAASSALMEQNQIDAQLREQLKKLFDLMTALARELKDRFKPGEQTFEAISRILSESLQVPALYSTDRSKLPYEQGRIEVVVSTISDLQVVDETAITWEQVVEFRKDKEARQKYRRLMHWLDKEMVGKEQGFIRDEIAERLEKYEFALRKHGITTVTGALSTVLKAEKLLLAAAVGAFASKVDPFAGLCVASGTLVANTVLEIVQQRLALEETKLGAEIAFVHDAKKKFGER